MKKEYSKKALFGGMLVLLALFFVNIAITSVYSQEKASIEQKKEAVSANKIESNNNNTTENNATSDTTVANETIQVPITETTIDEIETTEGDNLFATVKQGGPLMIFLILLGIVAMTIIIERLIYYTKNSVWKGQQIEEELREKAKESKAQYKEDLEDDLKAYFSIYTNKLERGLALLSGIGNLAPIAGFLGTVIGMISAFAAIAAAITVNAKVVAVGIQIALVTTAGGLFVAAPTLAFFYLFTHVIQNRFSHAEEIINEVTEGMPRLSNELKKGE